MAIPKGIRSNFEVLVRAANEGHLACVESTRTSDGSPVYLICAVWQEEDGTFATVPFGEMASDNPYILYNPPCPDCKLVDGKGKEHEAPKPKKEKK